MTLLEYQRLASRTINQNLFPDQQELHALHGLSAEIGEIHSIYQKRYQGHFDTEEHILKEMGDALWFMAELATALGYTLEEIAQMNIDKLKARYPAGFDEDKSLNRAEGDI